MLTKDYDLKNVLFKIQTVKFDVLFIEKKVSLEICVNLILWKKLKFDFSNK